MCDQIDPKKGKMLGAGLQSAVKLQSIDGVERAVKFNVKPAEAKHLAMLRGAPHVVQLIEDCESSLVLEVLRGGPLMKGDSFLKSPVDSEMYFGRESPRLEVALTVTNQLLHGLVEIHARGVAHRDIHGDNIILTDDGLRFIDFEYACSSECPETPSPMVDGAEKRYPDVDRDLARALAMDCRMLGRVLMSFVLGVTRPPIKVVPGVGVVKTDMAEFFTQRIAELGQQGPAWEAVHKTIQALHWNKATASQAYTAFCAAAKAADGVVTWLG